MSDNEYLEAMCDLCKEPLYVSKPLKIGKWIFHIECFQIARRRLTIFMDIILLPEDEFNEWMEDALFMDLFMDKWLTGKAHV